MKKVLILALCLCLSLAVLTACREEEPPHEHTFADVWNYNDTEHWHDATCEHTAEQADKGAHVDNDGNDICDTCGRVNNHTHTYAEDWTWDEEFHFHKSTCGHNVKDAQTAHIDENNDAICDVCTYDYDHEHEYAEEWSVTEGGHWHAPTCGHDVPGIDKAEHTDENNDGACDVCGDMGGHEHTYATEWSQSEDEHWHEVTCGHTIPVADKNAHVDEDGDRVCDACGYQPEHFHTFEEGWSSDANGHFHKSTCGHDVRKDETAHDGYEQDGVCDTCAYVVFRFYDVTVTLPEDSVTLTAPDGSSNPAVTVKEGSDVVYKLTMPGYIEIATIDGATIEGEPVDEGTYHTYTIKVSAVAGNVTVTMTLQKNSNLEVIIADGKQDMKVEKKWQKVEGVITFSVPSSGRYVIYSTSHAGLSGVTFTSIVENTIEQYENGISYAFDVEGAGDVSMNYSYFPDAVPEGGIETFTYVVVKVEPKKTLTELEGNDYLMPTNANVELTFTVPAPGLYQISSSSPVAWNDDVTSPHVFAVEAGNLTVTITMHYKLETQASFPFDWKIEAVGGANSVGLGDTAITAPLDEYYGITFTPDKTGSYHFALSETTTALYRWYSDEYWSAMNQVGTTWTSDIVEAGQTIMLYVRVNIYDDEITEAVDTVLTISYIPELTEDGYLAQTGMTNLFSNDYDTSEYLLTAPAGAQVSVDGGATWHQSVIAEVEGWSLLSYLVKSENGASEVTVKIERMVYEYILNVGMNTVTLMPGKAYTFKLTGSASTEYFVSYILAWDHAGTTVSYVGANLTSPANIDNYAANSSMLTVVCNEAVETTVTFTLTDTYVAPDYMREQLNGEYVVNGEDDVLYEITFTPVSDDGEVLIGTMDILDNNLGTLTGTYTYTYTKTDGASVTDADGNLVSILLSLDQANRLTFQCDGLRLPAVLEENVPPPVEVGDIVPGANVLKITDGVNGNPFTFIAPVDGEYTFAYVDGEENGFAMRRVSDIDELRLPYTVTLTAGEKFILVMGTKNMLQDNIDIFVTGPDSIMPEPFEPVDPSDSFYALLNGTYEVKIEMMGRLYLMTFTPDSLNNPNGTLEIEDSNTYKFGGTYRFLYTPGSGVTVTDQNGSPAEIYISQNVSGELLFQCPGLTTPQPLIPVGGGNTGGEDTPVLNELSLGTNAVVITDGWNGVQLPFTATEAGTYRFTWATGETNGDIIMDDGSTSETIGLPHEFTLTAGETITLIIVTLDSTSDTIDLVIEKL